MSRLSDYSKFDHIDSDDDDDDEDGNNTNKNINETVQTATTLSNNSTSVPTTGATQPLSAANFLPSNNTTPSAAAAAAAPSSSEFAMRKDPKSGRFIFEYKGNEIYQWEQSLDDVTIYVKAPPHVTKANQLNLHITPNHIQLGLKGHSQWFLDEPTYSKVDVSESTWSLEEQDVEEQEAATDPSSNATFVTTTAHKIITIYLTKAHRGLLWDTALQGNRGTDAATAAAATVSLDPLAKEQVKRDLLLERFQEEHPGFDFRDASFNGSVPDARTFMGGVKYN